MLKNMIRWCVSGLMLSDAQTSSRRRTMWRGEGSNVPTTVSGAVDRCAVLVARCVAFCLIGFFAAGQVGAQTITTVAGNGTAGFAGDSAAAVSAALAGPYRIALDIAGDIYVADTNNQRIRKITVATGVITTVAGNGTAGFSGDGGLATGASLNNPLGVAVDSAGNIYVADFSNNRIRMIAASNGVISTVAGNGTASFGGDGSPATSASLNTPRGVAVDSAGNIYVSDAGNYRIRKFTVGGNITTVAGNGTAGFTGDGAAATSASLNKPYGLAVDGAANIYVADVNNQRIRKITAANGVISTVAGNGTAGFAGDGTAATSANLNSPNGVAVDNAGNIYVADEGNGRIRKITVATGFITTVAGNGMSSFGGDGGLATSASFFTLRDVAVDSAGNLYLGDFGNNRIRKITAPPGIITPSAGNGTSGFAGDGGTATSASLNGPAGVAFDSAGNIYVADQTNHRIRKITVATGFISTVAGNGTAGFGGDGAAATSANLNNPRGVAVDSAGNIYVADLTNNRIRKITVATGFISTLAGTGTASFAGDGAAATSAGLNQPYGVAVDSAGNIYVADQTNHRVRKITVATGLITTVAGNGIATFGGDGAAATSASLNNPRGIAVDSAGNIYVADYLNHRIRKITAATGFITTVAGNGIAGFGGDGAAATSANLSSPRGVAVDNVGNLYVTDAGNQRIRKITVATGVITTVAGNGTAGSAGDFGAATSANLSTSLGLAVDIAGNIYIADTNNHRIRKVTQPVPGAPTIGTATAGVAQASVTFTAPGSDGGFAITGYTVTSSLGGFTATGASSPVVVTGLTNGTAYTFTVTATNAIGMGAASSASNSVTPSNATPGAPIIGTATAGNGQASVTFTAPGSNGGSAITGYTVTSSPGSFTGTGINSPIVVTGLTNGTAYTFTVTATNAIGTGAASAASNIVTPTPAIPDAPAIGTATAGNAQASVTFTAPGSNGGSPILDYAATCGAQSATNATSPITVTGLANGVAITCTVTARNAVGASAASSASNSVTPTSRFITTVAGNGTQGFGGDGAAAVSANLNNSRGVAVDSAGNIYVADSDNSRIRKITVATGVITTVAGNGAPGTAGDGGPATSANLIAPESVAVDSAGNIYVADPFNPRIRKVTVATGIITTVAGSGTRGFAGDGGPATSANLGTPYGVAVDSAGNIYVADQENSRIRKITFATGIITTFAGNGTQGFAGDGGPATSASLFVPYGLAVDSADNLYVADNGNERVRKITAATGIITTVAGIGNGGFGGDGGLATSADLDPYSVAVDSADNIYVADVGNQRIRKITVATGIITTVAGDGTQGFVPDGGPATAASFSNPTGVAVDGAGNIYVADLNNQRIRKISLAVPDAPTMGAVTAGNTQATINFTAPASDHGNIILSYTATSTPGNVTASCTAPCTSITVTGLTNGIAYTFTVKAINSVGPGAPSASSASVTPMPPAATLTLNAVLSRKSHGGPVPFDLPIDRTQPLSGAVSVEPRTIGAGHSIVFQFSGPVTAAGTASTTVGDASPPTFAGNEVIVTLTNVPDKQRLTITLSNVNGIPNVSPVSMGFLVGDVNNTRAVSAVDISQVRARSGQTANATNFRFDLNASGSINAADVAAVKARSGGSAIP